MLRVLPLALLAACTSPDGAETALPHAQIAPPPIPITLQVGAVVAGSRLVLQVPDAPPGLRITFITSADTTSPGFCPPPIAPTCLDLPRGWITLGSAAAGADGLASLRLSLPGALPPSIELQAYGTSGGSYFLTQGVITTTLQPGADEDGDGLNNADEISRDGDPYDPDTDDDGSNDRDEVNRGTNLRVRDTDADGLLDGEEATLGTFPRVPDSDADGRLDGDEVIAGTDPLDADSDDDGGTDGDEQLWGTDPLDADTDDGGATDGAEAIDGTDPLDPADDIVILPVGFLVINEIDYDQTGADTMEFIELYNPSTQPVSLADLAVVLFNGSSASGPEYARFALGSVAPELAPGAWLVIGNNNLAATLPAGTLFLGTGNDAIQNGAPDGLALVNTVTFEVLDALCYEGAMPTATPNGFPATISLVEGAPFNNADTGAMTLGRQPNGSDTDDALTDWMVLPSATPGAPN